MEFEKLKPNQLSLKCATFIKLKNSSFKPNSRLFGSISLQNRALRRPFSFSRIRDC